MSVDQDYPNVTLEQATVFIQWADGHESRYPYRLLRLKCPCATCVEEMTGQHLLDPDSVSGDIQAVDYIAVGSYAYQFLFTDAHYTGIFPYEYLRKLCPCTLCVAT